MNHMKFYSCPTCGNTMFSTGSSEISCCDRKLTPLHPVAEDEDHFMHIEEIEDDYFIIIHHEMSKQHYLSCAAYVTYDRVLFIKLYPEQSVKIRFPKTQQATSISTAISMDYGRNAN